MRRSALRVYRAGKVEVAAFDVSRSELALSVVAEPCRALLDASPAKAECSSSSWERKQRRRKLSVEGKKVG